MRKSYLGLLLVFLGAVGLDQVSKFHAHNTLMTWESPDSVKLYTGRSVPVGSIGSRDDDGTTPFNINFSITYSRNTGAAFSMLADLDDRIRIPFFYAVTLIAVVAIFFFFRGTPTDQRFTRFGLILVLSGAIGNFLDRTHWGFVVDFFDVDWNIFGWRHNFAVFNVADVCINIGVGCYIVDLIIQSRKAKQNNAEKAVAVENKTDGACCN
jgi:signal peptidase II